MALFCRVRVWVCLLVWLGSQVTAEHCPDSLDSMPGCLGSKRGDGGAVIVRDCTTVSGGMRSPLGPRNISSANTERVEVGWGKEIK